jgi:hypothetical protein
MWWPDYRYLISKGFTVYHGVQKPGDLIIVGIGTPHWVKSCGTTINSAWNIGPKTLHQFKAAFDRAALNVKINFRNLVPIHTLGLDLLNHESETLAPDLREYLGKKVQFIIEAEAESLTEINIKEDDLQVVTDELVISCENRGCYAELFWVYGKCCQCAEDKFSNAEIPAFFCIDCSIGHHADGEHEVTYLAKYTRNDLDALLERVNSGSGEVI